MHFLQAIALLSSKIPTHHLVYHVCAEVSSLLLTVEQLDTVADSVSVSSDGVDSDSGSG